MRVIVVLISAALVAAGCADTGGDSRADAGPSGTTTSAAPGSSGASASGGPTSSPANEPTQGRPTGQQDRSPSEPGRCHTSELTASLRPGGAAAGNRYATLVLTNHTDSPCQIYGYGGLGLLDAQHRPIPTHQYRDPNHPPVLIAVAPGDSASAVLHWGAVPSGSEGTDGPCEPEPSLLSVIPPDETDALLVDWPGGSVCERGRIDQWAYAPGIVRP